MADTLFMKLLRDIDVSDKRVFLRGDLDINLEGMKHKVKGKVDFEYLDVGNEITDQSVRLKNIKPTVDYLLEHGARQILIAGHIGRPKKTDPNLSTNHLVLPLSSILGEDIFFVEDFLTFKFEFIKAKKIVLLENLRFWEGEEKNDPEFAKQLATIADIYINEAFGVCHRAHASIVGVPAILPHGAGLHLEEEVNQLTKLIKNPERPLVAIIGGAKLETKIPVIESMAKVADWVLVGGLIAKELRIESGFSFAEATGDKKWKVDEKKVIVAELTEDTKDISEESIRKFAEIMKTAKTIVWNGNLGLTEEGFDHGSKSIAEAIGESAAYSLVGGGDTTEFLGSVGILSKFSFVSSGGGAMLEFLSGKSLPGIEALV